MQSYFSIAESRQKKTALGDNWRRLRNEEEQEGQVMPNFLNQSNRVT